MGGHSEAIVIEDEGANRSKQRRSMRKKKEEVQQEVVEVDKNVMKTDFEVVIKARIVEG